MNPLSKRIIFQRWKTKGSKRSALWENDGQGNSKSKTWDIQIFRPSDRPWGENRYNFEKLNDKSPGSLQDWKSFQKWQIWINKWILWLQGLYNLGQKLFVGICQMISTDCPNCPNCLKVLSKAHALLLFDDNKFVILDTGRWPLTQIKKWSMI